MTIYQPIIMSPVMILDNEAAAWLNLQAAGGSSAMPLNIQNMIRDGTFHQAARKGAAELDACGLLDRKAAAGYLAAKGLFVLVVDGFIGTVTSLNDSARSPSVQNYRSEPLILLSVLPSTSAIESIKQAAASTGAFPDGFNWEDRRVAVKGGYPDI